MYEHWSVVIKNVLSKNEEIAKINRPPRVYWR